MKTAFGQHHNPDAVQKGQEFYIANPDGLTITDLAQLARMFPNHTLWFGEKKIVAAGKFLGTQIILETE